MCCCCPSAISALFCLWAQSGFRKGTVAGALTFFPPEPPLYQYERRDRNGRVLGEDEEAEDPNKKQHKKKNKKEKRPDDDSDDEDELLARHTTSDDADDLNDDDSSDDGGLGEMDSPPGRGNDGPVEAETKGQTKEQMKSPIQQLTEQAAERRKRAKVRHARDSRDAAAGVSYKLLLDPRLQVPPFEDASIHAVKIPSRRTGAYVAAVVYRVPADRLRADTRTIIYSHGNATDIGAMFPIQVVLAHSLDCNVVVYDYSGYGESGGVPEEGNTYRDLEAVYDYTLDEVVRGEDGRNIILYGQSVGSGPCCYLAAKDSTIGGMVLHSPFTSGMRVLTPSRALACLDIYPNIDRIKKVRCPVFVIHGRLDQEVDISHGVELQRAVPPAYRRDPWWVPDRGHNDITDGSGKLAEYIRRLRLFLNSLDGE